MRLITLPGVFRPRSDAWLLARVIRARGLAGGARALDMFSGSGVLALTAARAGAREVVAVDALRRAVASIRLNARLNGYTVKALRGDLFAPVAHRRFDLIMANPPYLPDDGDEPVHAAARAWWGGSDGRVLIDRFCADAGEHLAPGGTIALVQSSLSDTPATLAALQQQGLETEVAATHTGPLGPLAAANIDLLRERGLVGDEDPQEEMHVILARRAAAAA
jgi:release factor glutamine methyltransferase